MNSSQLTISDLRLWVHLGYSEQEKTSPQAISIGIELNFPVAPLATTTDALSDTICYFQLTENIQQILTKYQPFGLIENLTSCIYACVYHNLLEKNLRDVDIKVSVNKLTPPVPGIQGGVTFTCKGTLASGMKDHLYQHWFSTSHARA